MLYALDVCYLLSLGEEIDVNGLEYLTFENGNVIYFLR